MIKIISTCPACGSDLKISALKCSNCNLELRNDFTLSKFDLLNENQSEFLISFLKHRGNMGTVQSELGISYPTAKKKLDDLLIALNLAENIQNQNKEKEEIDMTNLTYEKNSIKASDIIKQKLIENGGRVVVYTARNLPCEIEARPDGETFTSNKFPTQPYKYKVFDDIVQFLESQGGKASKGNAHCRLGDAKCDKTTVAGAVGYNYFEKKDGEFISDPMSTLFAVLEWADIAHNERGELVLTNSYKLKLRQNGLL